MQVITTSRNVLFRRDQATPTPCAAARLDAPPPTIASEHRRLGGRSFDTAALVPRCSSLGTNGGGRGSRATRGPIDQHTLSSCSSWRAPRRRRAERIDRIFRGEAL